MSTPLTIAREPEDTGQLDIFEGRVVQRYRNAPGAIPEFTSMDADGQPLKMEEGDIAVIQVEVLVTSVEVGAGYKGGIQTKSRDRVHHGKVLDGSQQVVHVVRHG